MQRPGENWGQGSWSVKVERGEPWTDFNVEDLASHTKEFGHRHEDRGKPLEESYMNRLVSCSDRSGLQQTGCW